MAGVAGPSDTPMHVDDAIECIKTLGVGTMLIKMDLESAYRPTLEITICWGFHGRGGPTSTGLSHLVCAQLGSQ